MIACKLILETIDAKAKERLHSPLRFVSYFLNYYFRNGYVAKYPNIKDASLLVLRSSFLDDIEIQIERLMSLKYKNSSGMFGRKLAISGQSKNYALFYPGILYSIN